jgi:hypothetical protein
VVPRISRSIGFGIVEIRPANRVRTSEGDGDGADGVGDDSVAAGDAATGWSVARGSEDEREHAEPSRSARRATSTNGRAGAIGTGV